MRSLEGLAELSGSTVREAVLDRLFARFCIGK
jgi:tRNA U34 5-carboxymethylaminomethyl modifying GTPase MnmE/TrmE